VREIGWMPAATVAFLVSPRLPFPAAGPWLSVAAASAAVLALAAWNLRGTAGWRSGFGHLLLAALFAAAWLWRAHGGTGAAEMVLVLFAGLVATALVLGEGPLPAATLVIAGSAALFLVLAADAREALVFLLTAAVALVVARRPIDLARPGLLYLAAGLGFLVRLCLFFELGDQYRLSSIRTAPGFVLVDHGLPLAGVTAIMLLKYALPWILVLGALVPSLARTGTRSVRHLLDLLTLGYVARFALVAAVIDPARILPNGLDGIIGVFCLSWAELVTLGIAAALTVPIAARRLPCHA